MKIIITILVSLFCLLFIYNNIYNVKKILGQTFISETEIVYKGKVLHTIKEDCIASEQGKFKNITLFCNKSGDFKKWENGVLIKHEQINIEEEKKSYLLKRQGIQESENIKSHYPYGKYKKENIKELCKKYIRNNSLLNEYSEDDRNLSLSFCMKYLEK